MAKRGKNQKKGPQNSKKIKLHKEDASFNNMEDEVDAFHKQRDMIPLDLNADDVDSDEDHDEQPIFDYEGINGDTDNDEDDDEEDDDDNSKLAKLARQAKYLKAKIGGVEDDENDDAEEDEKEHKVWSRGKGAYYGADNNDFELQSSGEDSPAEEEEEVKKLQKERAESLRAEDFGIESDEQDDSDQEPTLEEIKVKGKPKSKSSSDKEAEVDAVPMYEEVKKDLSALSKEEQMDVVYNSAPELVGLLAELNDATKQLETYVNPLLCKVRKGKNGKKEGLHYLEVKQLLLLSYSQAITFYLLLKSEGQPVRDHPVIARLVEIKNLLDKMKELDVHIPDGFEDMLVEKSDIATVQKPAEKGSVSSSDLIAKLDDLNRSLIEKQESSKLKDMTELVQMQPVELNEKKRSRDKRQDQVSSESVKMLQYRAALEEKLKQKAGSAAPKTDNGMKQKLKKLIGKLETTDDFDDDVMDLEGTTRDPKHASTLSSKLSQIVPSKGNMRKGVSGDDDLPERDDLGERRWKHELRVLSRAGIKSKDDVDDDDELENEPESLHGGANEDGGSEDGGSDDDYYNLIKQTHKVYMNPRALLMIEKNRGLTRDRRKQIKNPRKKYKLKHAKATNRRKGQVREVKQSKLSYGGETTGINPRISRSVRL
ncbi:Something about silencing protein 10 [Bienertia sinuspersici]